MRCVRDRLMLWISGLLFCLTNLNHATEYAIEKKEALVEVDLWLHTKRSRHQWIANCQEHPHESSATLMQLFQTILQEPHLSISFRNANCSYNGIHGKYPAALVQLYFNADSYAAFEPLATRIHERRFGDYVRPLLRQHQYGVRALDVQFPTKLGFTRFQIDGTVAKNGECVKWRRIFWRQYKKSVRIMRNYGRKYIVRVLKSIDLLPFARVKFAYFYPENDELRARFYVELYNYRIENWSTHDMGRECMRLMNQMCNCCRLTLTNNRIQIDEGSWTPPLSATLNHFPNKDTNNRRTIKVSLDGYVRMHNRRVLWERNAGWPDLQLLQTIWKHVKIQVEQMRKDLNMYDNKMDTFLKAIYEKQGYTRITCYIFADANSTTIEERMRSFQRSTLFHLSQHIVSDGMDTRNMLIQLTLQTSD